MDRQNVHHNGCVAKEGVQHGISDTRRVIRAFAIPHSITGSQEAGLSASSRSTLRRNGFHETNMLHRELMESYFEKPHDKLWQKPGLINSWKPETYK